MGITPFGRFLRKLRIDHGEIMKNMADKLGVTSSYLSAVEMGKRAIPAGWVDAVAELYCLNDKGELAHQAALSQREFKFEVPPEANDLARETALVFAKKVGQLDQETLNRLLDVMLEKGECE